jgi:hypothetical protein
MADNDDDTRLDKTGPSVDSSDLNDHRTFITARAISMVARAILGGRSAEEIAENPRAALSGEMEFIMIKRFEHGETETSIMIPQKTFMAMREMKNEWAVNYQTPLWTDPSSGQKYALLDNRWDQGVAMLIVDNKINIPNVMVGEVPVERWAYYIEHANLGNNTSAERVVPAF